MTWPTWTLVFAILYSSMFAVIVIFVLSIGVDKIEDYAQSASTCAQNKLAAMETKFGRVYLCLSAKATRFKQFTQALYDEVWFRCITYKDTRDMIWEKIRSFTIFRQYDRPDETYVEFRARQRAEKFTYRLHHEDTPQIQAEVRARAIFESDIYNKMIEKGSKRSGKVDGGAYRHGLEGMESDYLVRLLAVQNEVTKQRCKELGVCDGNGNPLA